MKLLMLGPSAVIAMRRVIDWALAAGHDVCLLDSQNPYKGVAPKRLRFIQFQADYDLNAVTLAAAPQKRRDTIHTGALQIGAVVSDFKPDVIHAHHMLLPTICCLEAGFAPVIVSVWGTLNGILGSERTALATEPGFTLLKKAAAVVVESPALYEACLAKGGLRRVDLIPLGTDTEAFRPDNHMQRVAWRRTLNIPADTTVLLSPRGWSRVYNQQQILEAYALAFGRFRPPTLLLFVQMARSASDSTASYIEQVRERVQDLGLSGAVRWLPQLAYEFMPSLYALSDIVVNYPLSDAFPSTLVEAVACGLPVISANLAAYQDTFIERFCTLAEPQNPAALADAMVAMVNSQPDEHKHRLQQARQVVVAGFDESNFQRAMNELYNAVVTEYNNPV